VPDPRAALEQITMFGRDIFERDDFTQILLNLKSSEAIKNLGQIFGTSRFLWEEFIRTQHQSIFPILMNQNILKIRKGRDEMLRELQGLVNEQDAFENKTAALNEYKDREIFRIDLRHILGGVSFLGEFTEEFTDLVEAVVDCACALVWEELLKQLPHPMVSEQRKSEWAILGLGKLGGRELGFASDLELMFVYSDAPDSSSEQSQQNLKFYTEFARLFCKVIHARSEGVFEIDLRVRPFGKDGPLAVSLELFKSYYRTGGEAWNFERQLLVKLRPIAGSASVGGEICACRDAFVYGGRPFDFDEFRKLRLRQREEMVRPGTLNAKYSAGGLIDIEYLVQALQIVYGVGPESRDIRVPNTLAALQGLRSVGAVDEGTFRELRISYVFLRGLINGLRIVRGNARDLTIPEEGTPEFLILARRIGYSGTDEAVGRRFKQICADRMQKAAELYECLTGELARHRRQEDPKPLVRQAEGLPRINLEELIRDDVSAKTANVLRKAGFSDVRSVVSQLKRMMPNTPSFEPFRMVMEEAWPVFQTVPDPDLAVSHLVQFSDAMRGDELFWDSILYSSSGPEVLLRLFGTSRYLSKILISNPEHWDWVRERENFSSPAVEKTVREVRGRNMTVEMLRRFRHAATLRIVLADRFAGVSLEKTHEMFTDLADVVLERIFCLAEMDPTVCVLGFGKLGGRELNFSSDIDLVFVGSEELVVGDSIKPIQTFLNLLKGGGLEDFLYRVDLRLRPHGDHGSLVMKAGDFTGYYQREADAWEFQALMKIRAVAGNGAVEKTIREVLEPLIYRERWSPHAIARIREIKRRYEEMVRLQGEEETNVKLGFGGIRDIEFAVQMIQLKEGARCPSLRNTRTLGALEEMQRLKLLPEKDCERLREGYEFLRRIENYLQLYENRQEFNVPSAGRECRTLARALGIFDEPEDPAEKRLAGRLAWIRSSCREIFERVFYSEKG
jgi:glutamate-ammonia-ligase adenylyltransferase